VSHVSQVPEVFCDFALYLLMILHIVGGKMKADPATTR
jgi:hypothetical protein